MTAVPDSDRAAVLDALRSPEAADEVDTYTILRLSRLNSIQARPALEQLVADGEVVDRWTGGNPSVRMYRLAGKAEA